VREIISASHILTDLTLAPATLIYDYLAEPTDTPGETK
jgi:acetoacetate decarboxylase